MDKEQIKAYEEQLKPCPFCGGKATLCELRYGFNVKCLNHLDCSVLVVSNITDEPEETIEIWNKRGGEENG